MDIREELEYINRFAKAELKEDCEEKPHSYAISVSVISVVIRRLVARSMRRSVQKDCGCGWDLRTR